MDLKAYYRRIRELETSFEDEFLMIKSLATEAGGVAGRVTEVSRLTAARMIVDGRAEVASEPEAEAFRAQREEARKQETEKRQASQIQFTVLSEDDLRALQRSTRSRKE